MKHPIIKAVNKTQERMTKVRIRRSVLLFLLNLGSLSLLGSNLIFSNAIKLPKNSLLTIYFYRK